MTPSDQRTLLERDSWANGKKDATSKTPPAFRNVLLNMARSAERAGACGLR